MFIAILAMSCFMYPNESVMLQGEMSKVKIFRPLAGAYYHQNIIQLFTNEHKFPSSRGGRIVTSIDFKNNLLKLEFPSPHGAYRYVDGRSDSGCWCSFRPLAGAYRY